MAIVKDSISKQVGKQASRDGSGLDSKILKLILQESRFSYLPCPRNDNYWEFTYGASRDGSELDSSNLTLLNNEAFWLNKNCTQQY